MSYKVLLADDSLTIQKVIKITLANEPYELVDCNDESELLSMLKAEKPHMVFLDFNLSETKSGYELSREIKEKAPDVKILMLYGTFDNIDESELLGAGVSDKVVKPFDSNKFISICKSIASEVGEAPANVTPAPSVEEELIEIEESPVEEIAEEDKTGEFEVPKEMSVPQAEETGEEDQWVVNSPELEEEVEDAPEEMIIPQEMSAQNQLQQDVGDWGIEVPGKIGEEEETTGEIPSVIDSEYDEHDQPTKEIEIPEEMKEELKRPHADAIEEEEHFPSDSDLEYPEVSEVPDGEVELEMPEEGPTSKLVSLDELSPIDGDDVTDDQTQEYDLNSIGTESEEDLSSLQEQIADETEDDLWAADEYITDAPEEIATTPTSEPIADEVTADISEVAAASIDMNDIAEKIRPIVEELVRQQFAKTIEKVAWEVIPDMAENLIKQELTKISNSVISEN
jgi:DNA-binding response OmpR family regulator